MKSIFYDARERCKERSLKVSQQVKEFINHQEISGNKVLIPKVNNKIIAVQIGSSNLIKIYNISQQSFVRQFVFTR